MKELQLQSNEGIILQSTAVMHKGVCHGFTCELILTNLNVFSIKRGAFEKIKEMRKYPLNQLKKLNGVPQIRMGKNPRNAAPQLQMIFVGSQEIFEFRDKGKKQINQWIEEVNKALGAGNDLSNNEQKESFFGKIKGGIKSIKNIFTSNAESINITIKCIGCMAPITGEKGEIAKCKYCDTKQTLE